MSLPNHGAWGVPRGKIEERRWNTRHEGVTWCGGPGRRPMLPTGRTGIVTPNLGGGGRRLCPPSQGGALLSVVIPIYRWETWIVVSNQTCPFSDWPMTLRTHPFRLREQTLGANEYRHESWNSCSSRDADRTSFRWEDLPIIVEHWALGRIWTWEVKNSFSSFQRNSHPPSVNAILGGIGARRGRLDL